MFGDISRAANRIGVDGVVGTIEDEVGVVCDIAGDRAAGATVAELKCSGGNGGVSAIGVVSCERERVGRQFVQGTCAANHACIFHGIRAVEGECGVVCDVTRDRAGGAVVSDLECACGDECANCIGVVCGEDRCAGAGLANSKVATHRTGELVGGIRVVENHRAARNRSNGKDGAGQREVASSAAFADLKGGVRSGEGDVCRREEAGIGHGEFVVSTAADLNVLRGEDRTSAGNRSGVVRGRGIVTNGQRSGEGDIAAARYSEVAPGSVEADREVTSLEGGACALHAEEVVRGGGSVADESVAADGDIGAAGDGEGVARASRTHAEGAGIGPGRAVPGDDGGVVRGGRVMADAAVAGNE